MSTRLESTDMETLPTPVLDNHLHLHPAGDGAEAAAAFARAGGTHLLVVNRPSWHFVEGETDIEAFRETFERTIELVEAASSVIPGTAWPVLGVHPVLLPRLVNEFGWDLAKAVEVMRSGLSLAAEYVADDRALALKSGRPHFEVTDQIWSGSNELIRHAFELAASADCAVQLHTEANDDLSDLAEMARKVDLDPTRVVKHYAAGPVDGVTPSVIARSEAIEAITGMDTPFFLETDFLDDPARPGAVLGPKVVPRRSRRLADDGRLDLLERAHVETPAMVYGIDTEATLE